MVKLDSPKLLPFWYKPPELHVKLAYASPANKIKHDAHAAAPNLAKETFGVCFIDSLS
jgi:hypothetical protein